MKIKQILFLALFVLFILTSIKGRYKVDFVPFSDDGTPFSPAYLSWSKELQGLLVLEASAKRVDLLNISDGELIKGDSFYGKPTGLCKNSSNIFITSDYERGHVHILDQTLSEIASFSSGPGSRSPVLIESRGVISVCHTWLDEVGVYKLPEGELVKTISVLKQPFVSVLSPDEEFLFVANFTTHQRADQDTVSSAVSVINTRNLDVQKNILLANGSNALRGMTLSSDGEYVMISHNLGRFQVPTTQLEQGWMNTSALSVIKVSDLSYRGTVLLDEPEYGAAGSWGICTYNGYIAVSHSGTHDFSIIDEKAFFKKLESSDHYETLAYDLNFLSGIRKRIKLPGNGPRAITASESGFYLGMYFSDTVNQVILTDNKEKIISWPLNDGFNESQERLGEKYFNDAVYCFQGWQSCNGCHPLDARTDGLNWDLLNDGVGNPKNCKSLLLSHETPPAMITGIRPNAESAVRAGFRHIQFASVPEEYAASVDFYLRSLKPEPNPHLINGKLDSLAQNGKKIFDRLGCQNCHQEPYYTDMKMHYLKSPNDTLGEQLWDTPTLVEVWRSGPWMHDGRCAKMRDVFEFEHHGIEEELSDSELTDLAKYVLSL